jgi:putative transposon-encoded protein
VQDLNDNYQFLYPFGWQEVTVSGVDVVYKDVVEPLESVSVTITPTDKKDVTEFGDIADVSVPTALKVVSWHTLSHCIVAVDSGAKSRSRQVIATAPGSTGTLAESQHMALQLRVLHSVLQRPVW